MHKDRYKKLRPPEYYNPKQTKMFNVRNMMIHYIAERGSFNATQARKSYFPQLGIANDIVVENGYYDLFDFANKLTCTIFKKIPEEPRTNVDKEIYRVQSTKGILVPPYDPEWFSYSIHKLNEFSENYYKYTFKKRVRFINRKEYNKCLQILYNEYAVEDSCLHLSDQAPFSKDSSCFYDKTTIYYIKQIETL